MSEVENKGEISDGYHTFNELYEHRHALFSALVQFTNSWKSKLHSDGTMFDGWFIAGINTPAGQATYHMPMIWWDFVKTKELDKAPEWDGHTAHDTVNRLKMIRADLAQPTDYDPTPKLSAPADDIYRVSSGQIVELKKGDPIPTEDLSPLVMSFDPNAKDYSPVKLKNTSSQPTDDARAKALEWIDFVEEAANKGVVYWRKKNSETDEEACNARIAIVKTIRQALTQKGE